MEVLIKINRSNLSLLVLFLISLGCTSTKQESKTDDTDKEQVKSEVPNNKIEERIEVVRYATGDCRGDCAVFDITMYSDGHALLVAKKNVNEQMVGEYHVQLNSGTVDEFKSVLESIFNDLEESYVDNRTDMPTNLIRFNGKTVKFSGTFPESLKSTVTGINEIVKSSQWEKSE